MTSCPPDELWPGDPGYDEARRVRNAMIDHRPAVILRCRDTGDVVAAVARAVREGLEIGVKCGGHSVVGHAVPDGGLMIDLSPMGEVRVDAGGRRAFVRGGALLGALDRATQPFGLATTAGNVSHTGVGGLALGGGMGWLARKYGLTCDNLVSAEIVTANGAVVRVSADEEPELFWGLRGGGGNFGVVTEFEFRLHDVGTHALSVELDVPVEDADAPLARWRDLSLVAPREATYAAVVHGGLVTLGFVWVGDLDTGREHATGMDSLGTPVARRDVELSYLNLQRRDDDVESHDLRRYWKGHYFTDLPDAALEAFLMHDRSITASLQSYGGAIADIANDESAFSHRDAAFEYVGASRWTDPGEDAARMVKARASAAQLEPFASGAYVNTLGDDGEAGVRRAYPSGKLERLQALKAAVDPANLFHLNHNIPLPSD